jgi:hypothetical protein
MARRVARKKLEVRVQTVQIDDRPLGSNGCAANRKSEKSNG